MPFLKFFMSECNCKSQVKVEVCEDEYKICGDFFKGMGKSLSDEPDSKVGQQFFVFFCFINICFLDPLCDRHKRGAN